ncbi:hypothetical protein ABN110_24170, partial [Escherichia coli]|uniref:hypothetical protein n=1 Tax=Escherichia coli TaxID=562 RepID=UPI0032DB259D
LLRYHYQEVMKQHNPVNSARSILLISIPERLFKIFPFLPASEIKKTHRSAVRKMENAGNLPPRVDCITINVCLFIITKVIHHQ